MNIRKELFPYIEGYRWDHFLLLAHYKCNLAPTMLTVPRHYPQPPLATDPRRPGTTDTAETQPDLEAHHKPKQLRRVLTRLGDEDLSDARKVSAVVIVWLLGAVPGMGLYAFHGFIGLTLGQTVLRAIHPNDAGYATSIRTTMQTGALGGGIMGIILWTVVLLSLLLAVLAGHLEGFRSLMNASTASTRKAIGTLAFYTAVGAASGPLGVAILKHHRSLDGRADLLDVADAARVGAFGWFLLATSWLLNHQSTMLKSRER